VRAATGVAQRPELRMVGFPAEVRAEVEG
jgi:hypothetical protein